MDYVTSGVFPCRGKFLVLSCDETRALILVVLDEEVRRTVFSMAPLKAPASRDQAIVVSSILETFYYFSGQKVNKSKSKVFFSPNTPSSVIESYCACFCLCCKQGLAKTIWMGCEETFASRTNNFGSVSFSCYS
ncbi:hypothetical protein PVK06_028336 [Gossypium arboreum]|uniref:Uncharacterized protein n=1 Tax=Gossypium arboreum TaxID=29729 RepID=A0ABR0P490_GOSAR|nr:hypothetical protein PVK06_028336 [Gossypium arboreum]